jgi:class 3 adenylate cyclase
MSAIEVNRPCHLASEFHFDPERSFTSSLVGVLSVKMPEEQVHRRLAAILAGDIAGYSRLMSADEEGTLRDLKGHRKALVDPKIVEHRGRIVKTTGDGMLVEFVSVVDAVRCAVDIQRGMMERNAEVPANRRILFRIGLNVGDIISDDNDIYGDGVNIAARLEAPAEPGGICVSRIVHDQVRDKLFFGFEDMGEQSVKNMPHPIGVHRIHISETAPSAGMKSATAGAAPDPISSTRPSIPMSIASFEARSRASFRCRGRPSSCSSSTSKPRMPSASTCRGFSSSAPTR